MLWVIIGVIIVIAVCAMAASSSNQEKMIAQQRDQALAARWPEAFQILFAEEYPEFASDMTYSKADKILNSWNAIMDHKEYKKHMALFGNKFKSPADAIEARMFFVATVSALVSEGFAKHASENIVETYSTLNRIMTSSRTRAQA